VTDLIYTQYYQWEITIYSFTTVKPHHHPVPSGNNRVRRR